MTSRSVDYSGRLAARYVAGRELTDEAVRAWRAAVAPLVGTGDVVVDVGAGAGRFTRRLAGLGPGQVVAVEPAAGMVSAAAAADAVGDAAWVTAGAERLPLRSACADVTWMAFVVHYLDLEPAGDELARVLRTGGRALVWSVFPDRFDDLAWLRWFPTARQIDEERMPSVDAVEAAWRRSGLRLRARTDVATLVANDLAALADRVASRAISTLELVTDDEFELGVEAMRRDAALLAPQPVYSPHTLLVFQR